MKPVIQKLGMLTAMLLTFLSASAYAFEVDGIWYDVLDESAKEVAVIDGIYSSGDITIPASVTKDNIKYNVTSIGSAFMGCSNLTSITIPNSVTSIGNQAFMGCSSLTSITIPNSVTSIGNKAFDNCSALKTLHFTDSSSIQSIGEFAFHECTNLEDISFPLSLMSIGRYAFSSCSKLKRVILPKNLISIGHGAFYNCIALEDVFIPSSLKTVSSSAFSVCPNMSNITIEEGVETLENDAFIGDYRIMGSYGPTKIKCIILPRSIKNIGSDNFPESNIVILNGSVSLYPAMDSNYYILDSNVPSLQGSSTSIFYFYDKEIFLTKSGLSSSWVKQLNEGMESVSLVYNGQPQGPNRNSMPWAVGDTLKSFGISYNFSGIENTDCGEWHGEEQVTFQYGDWTFTSPILYDYKITPIPLKLKCPSFTIEYGDDIPNSFELEPEGFIAHDNLDNSVENLTFRCSANNNSNVGSYPITISATAKNYTVSYEHGLINIVKAPLSISVSNTTRLYGQENPQYEFTYQGFKLNDTETSAFSQRPSVTTEANVKSDVGVYPLIVNGGVARNYEITEYVPGNLTITKAPLTLSANNAERLYHTENPDFDFTLTELVNDDDRSCLSKAPEFTCTATLTSGCGDYEIIPSNAEAKNYDISYSKGKLTIAKSPLSISVVDVSREYGDPNPRFEFIYSGFKDGDDATSLSVLPKATCIARPNSPVGYYDIEVSGAESQNYDISYTSGILTVNAAPLTIRAKDAKRTFGTENPEFEISYFGFKNEDDENSLFRLPQVSTSANAQSPVGNYPIVVSDAAAKNYNIIYEQGVLTIAKGTLIARVKNASRIYGEDNPQFQVEYSGFLNGDSESVISIKPQIYTEANRTSKVGTYAILASGASSSNYDFDYQNGELVVNPREISASVGNYTRPYGTSNPQFEIEYNGFVNGDDKTSITTPSIATCEANLQSNVGSYTISLSGGQGENYIVSSFTNGILTIEKANQSIEWNQDLSALNQYDQIGLTATSTSGLPVDYEVANNSVIDIYNSGGKTYIDCYGTGTVTIRATQSGNENYYPAEIVTNRVTVVGEGGSVDPSSPEISINVNTAGTLSSMINVSKKYQIKSLTVSGFLNGTDIRYIREMAGRGVNGTETNGILEKLNLSRATIVSGGEYYYTTSTYTSGRRYTSDNQISDYMFYGCSTLTNLTLPQNCTKIGDHTFDGCLNLTTIIMPDDIESIGAYAFNGDISLSRISVPENTVSIGNYAFQNCIGLNTLILGSSVKSIGNGMLNGCPNIQEITLNNNNEYFSTLNGVLYNKAKSSLIIYPAGKQFQTFEIPDGVTEIKNSGFYEVVALKYLFLPESLTSVGLDAFKGCSNLSKLYARPTTPPTCANDCFDAVSKSNCALYVPRGSHNSYWAAPVWGDFLKIEESNDLSVGGNIAKPDYGFEFTETTLNKGKFTYIPVSMNNVDPVVAFNCEIVLPEGVAFYKDSNDQIVFKQSERFPLSQNINSNLLPNGVLRVISTSSTNEAFSGTEGVLFYLPLLLTDTNANEDSEYNLIVKDIEFTKKNQSGYSSVQSPDITVSLTVGEYNMGDANGDGRITGADAVLAMSYFLGKNTPNIILKAADMNYDGKITSIDVVLITDELLAQNQSPKALTKGVSNYYGNLLVSGTPSISSDVAFNISVPSAYKFTAIQMDVTIPDGYNIKSMEVASDNKATHNVRYYQHPNGMTRIFISSDNNADFTSDNVLSIELEEENSIHSSQEIFIEDVLAVEISDDEILEWNICGSMTNISELSITPENNVDDDILIWVENSTIYIKSSKDGVIYLCDISGRSRSIEINAGITSISVVPGIYLINHKKIIVK